MTASVPEWVLDTNVVVSGLLSPHGPPGRIIEALLDRRLILAFDDRIEWEYRDVLTRPKFQIEEAHREAFLSILSWQSHRLAAPVPGLMASDPEDTKFLEVAITSPDRTLVTGNIRHYPVSGRKSVRVIPPAEAVKLLIQD